LAPLSSVRNVIAKRIKTTYFTSHVPDIFKNDKLAFKIKCNILIIHGNCDFLIPIMNSVEIFKK
jgi:hypothetical protein